MNMVRKFGEHNMPTIVFGDGHMALLQIIEKKEKRIILKLIPSIRMVKKYALILDEDGTITREFDEQMVFFDEEEQACFVLETIDHKKGLLYKMAKGMNHGTI